MRRSSRRGKWLALPLVGWLAVLGIGNRCHAAELPARATEGSVQDIFGRLRNETFVPRLDYWQRAGEALQRLETLEGATYDPESGTLLLIGKPAEEFGPYQLDDLMVALRAALFEREALGMTIDPDPKNLKGPRHFVRYFGGSENTAFGWVMFECDRLLKCYAAGKDNFTSAALRPNVPESFNMLDRYAKSSQSLVANEPVWTRFSLAQDIHDRPAEEPQRANGSQPVGLLAHEGRSLRLSGCRVFLRTQPMEVRAGELHDAPRRDEQAEQFALHFSNHYADFARLEPVFARLEALSRLVSLADWIVEQKVPVDTEAIFNYRQQVSVITPSTTPAVDARLRTASHELSYYGGVEFDSRTFFTNSEANAAPLAEAARQSEASHLRDMSWQFETPEGVWQVAAQPTLKTKLRANPQRSRTFVELRRANANEMPEGLLPPEAPDLAQADRFVSVVRESITLARLEQYRRLARGPPEGSIGAKSPTDFKQFLDNRHLAESDRKTAVDRITMPVAEIIKLGHEPPKSRGPPPSDSLPPDRQGFRPESDRVAALARFDTPLVSKPWHSPPRSRGPPDANFQALDERTVQVPREAVPLPDAGKPHGLELFKTGDGVVRHNLPRMISWHHPRHKWKMNVQGVAGTEVTIADSLTLLSELGDIAIPFGEPKVDQQRRVIHYPTNPPGLHDVRGYYPQTSTLEFDDATLMHFDAEGYLQRLDLPSEESFEFRYAAPLPEGPKGDRGRSRSRRLVESCEVVSASNPERPILYTLVSQPTERESDVTKILASAVTSLRDEMKQLSAKIDAFATKDDLSKQSKRIDALERSLVQIQSGRGIQSVMGTEDIPKADSRSDATKAGSPNAGTPTAIDPNIGALTEVVRSLSRKVEQLSTTTPDGRTYPRILGNMKGNSDFQREMRDAVQESLRKVGTVIVRNETGIDQQITVNGRSYWVRPGVPLELLVPAGTLVAHLTYLEPPKHWTIAPPNYRQVIGIRY